MLPAAKRTNPLLGFDREVCFLHILFQFAPLMCERDVGYFGQTTWTV